MLKNSYDIVIWGDSICSVLTAAGLIDRGLNVLFLIDSGAGVSSSLYDENPSFSLGGIPETELTKKLLAQLGLDFYDRSIFKPCQPLIQLVVGMDRLDIMDDLEENAREICRGISDDSAKLNEVLLDGLKKRESLVEFLRSGIDIFPPHNLGKKISYFLRRRGKNTPVPKESFHAAASGLKSGALLEKAASLFALSDNYLGPLLPLPLCGRPSFSPIRGMRGLKKLISEQLRNKGVDVLETSGLTGLEFVKNRVDAVRFDGKVVPARAFLFGGLAETLVPFMPDSFPGRAMKKMLSLHKPAGFWQSVFIAVEEAVMPVGMHDELIVEEVDGSALNIRRMAFPDGAYVSDGRCLLKLSRPMRLTGEVKGVAGLPEETVPDSGSLADDFECMVVDELRKLIPFMDGRFKVLHRSYDSRRSSSDDYFYGRDYAPPFNIGTLSPRTNFPNLFLANKELAPILGPEGDFVAAEVLAGYLVEAVSLPEK